MSDEFEQFETYDAVAVEERMKNGGVIPAGKYAATLHGAKRTTSKEKQTPGWELTFKITEGVFKDLDITDTIYITNNEKAKDRLLIFSHRLGLLEKKPDDTGYVKTKGKVDFLDVLDTPCVIETILEPDKENPNKKWVRLAFGGIFKPGDPDAKLGPTVAKDKDGGGGGKGKGGAGASAKSGDDAKPAKEKVNRKDL